MKKFIAILLSICLSLGICAGAFAAGSAKTPEKNVEEKSETKKTDDKARERIVAGYNEADIDTELIEAVLTILQKMSNLGADGNEEDYLEMLGITDALGSGRYNSNVTEYFEDLMSSPEKYAAGQLTEEDFLSQIRRGTDNILGIDEKAFREADDNDEFAIDDIAYIFGLLGLDEDIEIEEYEETLFSMMFVMRLIEIYFEEEIRSGKIGTEDVAGIMYALYTIFELYEAGLITSVTDIEEIIKVLGLEGKVDLDSIYELAGAVYVAAAVSYAVEAIEEEQEEEPDEPEEEEEPEEEPEEEEEPEKFQVNVNNALPEAFTVSVKANGEDIPLTGEKVDDQSTIEITVTNGTNKDYNITIPGTAQTDQTASKNGGTATFDAQVDGSILNLSVTGEVKKYHLTCSNSSPLQVIFTIGGTESSSFEGDVDDGSVINIGVSPWESGTFYDVTVSNAEPGSKRINNYTVFNAEVNGSDLSIVVTATAVVPHSINIGGMPGGVSCDCTHTGLSGEHKILSIYASSDVVGKTLHIFFNGIEVGAMRLGTSEMVMLWDFNMPNEDITITGLLA